MGFQDIAALLGPAGPFAHALEGFAPRAAQQDMAGKVAAAIARRSSLLIEAGTGTGKTFAYLVPAVVSGRRVVISTGTKTLQDQLYFRDLPRVLSVLGLRRKVALLKGRSNYLCLQRLQQTVRTGHLGNPEQVHQLAAIREWAAHTKRGDRMELAEVPENAAIWSRVTSTTENCLGAECPFYDQCYVYRARREAMEADIVVVNHHLLFADMSLKQEGFGELLPQADAIIVDEAHQLPNLLGQFFSRQVSTRQLEELGRDALAECRDASGAMAVLREPVEQLTLALDRLKLAAEDLPARAALRQLSGSAAGGAALTELTAVLARLQSVLNDQAGRSQGLERVDGRVVTALQLLRTMTARGTIGENDADPDTPLDLDTTVRPEAVCWYERTRHHLALHLTPLDASEPLETVRATTAAAWIYTSATLSADSKFDYFKERLHLGEEIESVLLPSPFDFTHQTLCYLPEHLPLPSDRDYNRQLVEAVLPVLEASRGRAFLLFTSHRALREVAERLRQLQRWPLLVQGEAPRHRLLEEFRRSEHAILLGAASFWEGVDVIGEALSVVIIDKLPFASPDDPVLQARIDRLRQSGRNAFQQLQVPAAVIALKQGAGRLIRDVEDRGILVLCDPRLTHKGYGKQFLRSLPDMPRTHDIAAVRAFFAD